MLQGFKEGITFWYIPSTVRACITGGPSLILSLFVR